jgi:hypothetical protein
VVLLKFLILKSLQLVKVQGNLDVFITLAGASGGALSGMVIVNTSDAAYL